MKAKVLLSVIILHVVCICMTSVSEAEEDFSYVTTPAAQVNAFCEDGDFMWVGTEFGLSKINKTTGEIALFFNQKISDLPEDTITAVAIDSKANVWCGTALSGLAKFDGNAWTLYNNGNSSLPNNVIKTLYVDDQDTVWIATQFGVATFDGTDWSVINTMNSDIPNNVITDIEIDGNGIVWMAYEGGLACFDGETWQSYTSRTSDLPGSKVLSIAVDEHCCVWVGTSYRLGKFDGEKWDIYDKNDYGMMHDEIMLLDCDKRGNVWIVSRMEMSHYDGESWTPYKSKDSGLPDDLVDVFALDSEGRAWMGTSKEITVFDGADWQTLKTGALEGVDIWTRKSDMPYSVVGHSVCAAGGKIYAIGGAPRGGGYTGSPAYQYVQEYDPDTDTWELKKGMKNLRMLADACVVNRKIYVIGGHEADNTPGLSSLEIYDPAADTWTQGADMPTARYGHTCCMVDNKIYVMGGATHHTYNEGSVETTAFEVYDPASDTWTKKADIPANQLWWGRCAVNGKIYLFGGSSITMYDPAEDTWESAADLPVQAEQVSILAFEVNGNICILSGVPSNTGIERNPTLFYNPETNEFTEKTALPPRRYCSGCEMNGKIYVTGGANKIKTVGMSINFDGIPEVYVYDTGFRSDVTPFVASEPVTFSIMKNHPNPFNPSTTITYSIVKSGKVHLAVYDLLGRRVATLADRVMTPGEYAVTWNAQGFSSGVYFCRMEHEGMVKTHKMLLVK